MPNLLVIGYGNEIRGDDAAGPAVAALVESWKLPGVRVLSRHQLTPELADDLAQAEVAVFVDASLEVRDTIRAAPLEPTTDATELLAHVSSPAALLALARSAFGKCPHAWMLEIPAANFDFGAPLSPATSRGIQEAAEWIRKFAINPEAHV